MTNRPRREDLGENYARKKRDDRVRGIQGNARSSGGGNSGVAGYLGVSRSATITVPVDISEDGYTDLGSAASDLHPDADRLTTDRDGLWIVDFWVDVTSVENAVIHLCNNLGSLAFPAPTYGDIGTQASGSYTAPMDAGLGWFLQMGCPGGPATVTAVGFMKLILIG